MGSSSSPTMSSKIWRTIPSSSRRWTTNRSPLQRVVDAETLGGERGNRSPRILEVLSEVRLAGDERYNPRKRQHAQKDVGNEADLAAFYSGTGGSAPSRRTSSRQVGPTRCCTCRSNCRNSWAGSGPNHDSQPLNNPDGRSPGDPPPTGTELEGAW